MAGALFAAYLFLVLAPVRGSVGLDAFAYWSASPPLYDAVAGDLGAYVYSPAFYQATAPLRALDWPAFLTLWMGIAVGSAIWLGPLALAFPFTALEIYHGNVHLLIAVAIVLGFRHPWTWAFVLHTKATCGVGLLWFVFRREWRSLAIALGATAAVAGFSFVMMPDAWREYVAFLLEALGRPDATTTKAGLQGFPVPLALRLAIAVVIVGWGARTDRRWTVPIAAAVALPVFWWTGLAVAAGALALAARDARALRATLPAATSSGVAD